MRADLEQAIDERIKARIAKRKWTGLAIGVRQQDETWIRCYGHADLENKVAVHDDTVFAIGSVTKQFTAALVLRLAELEKLSVDDEITQYLPDYPVGDRKVTIHHLLTHTSGIQTYSALPEFRQRYGEDLSPEAIADMFKNEPFQFEPGERYEYNNSGYHLLGMIIENVVGKPYGECITEYLFEPLGLQKVRYFANTPIIANRARGYVVASGVVQNSPYVSMNLPYSAGAIGAAVGDLLEWQDALNSHKILSEASFQRMCTPGTVASGEPTGYGYGMGVATFEGERKFTHDGGIPGFTAVLSHYPAHDLTTTVLMNTGFANPWA